MYCTACGVGSVLWPQTVTLAPSTPACWISCLALARLYG